MNENTESVEKHKKQMEKHARKRNLSEARRKSGSRGNSKKPRQKKISRNEFNEWEDLDSMDYEMREPIMPKGERDRRRKIEKQAQNSKRKGNASVEIGRSGNTNQDSPELLNGLVVEAGSGMCRVEIDGALVLCDIRGSIKDADTGYINVIAVGDRVLVNRNGSDKGVVEAIKNRKNILTRPYSPDAGKISTLEQIVVANVDQVLIVASWREPYIWPALIDRYLIAAKRNQIESKICVNKVDLIEDNLEFESTINAYKQIGEQVLLTSAVTGIGIPELKNLLKDKTTVLAGLSGVGKSSLLTSIQPDLNLKIGRVSEHGLFTGQGRHTTTQSSLWRLGQNSIVVDTPGVRTFGIAGMPPSDLSSWYPEMTSPSQTCKFTDCAHINEPQCGVIDAVEKGLISKLRYKNYSQIYDELSE